MNFRDILSADLPAPRDDEPASLRDDIVAELADHLACMYHRELLRGADASSAKARVVERFGDPAAMTRRLWFDAMKGKIMSQRILVSCCIFLTLISLAPAGVMWMQVVDSRRLAVAMTARAEVQLHEAQKAQEQMLKQLAVLSKAVENPRPPDWIPVSFKLTQETLDGPPGVGFQAALGRGTGGSNKPEAIERDSDANGMIDFGVVQPGDWEFRISRDLEDKSSWQASGKLNVGLGNKIEKPIICPRISPVQPALTVQIDWPADLAGKDLAALAVFHHKGFSYQPQLRWDLSTSPYSGWWTNRANFLFLCEKDKMDADMNHFYFWRLANPSESGMEPAKSSTANPIRQNQVYLDLVGLDRSPAPKTLHWHEGSYQLAMMAVVKPMRNPAPSMHDERCELFALAGQGFLNQSAYAYQEPPTDVINPYHGQVGYGQKPFDAVQVTEPFWKETESALVVKRDRPNNWTLHLPDELTKAVREKLNSFSEK